MSIDRSDPADDLGAAGKDKGTAVSGDGPPDHSRACPDSALRMERTVAFRAARVENLERATGTPAMRRIETGDSPKVRDDPRSHGGARDDGRQGGDQPGNEADRADHPGLGRHGAHTEKRTRGEAYADTRQSFESGWERHRLFEAPRAELARFRAERAGLPGTSPQDAARYIDQYRTMRPWLATAERASPESRRIMVAIDQGTGHGLIRHEGWVTEEANMRRAAYLEDPAQLDGVKRLRGIDGLKPNDSRHICAYLATRITDPDAFATAFARGTEHPDVRAALSMPYDQVRRSAPVQVPISDVLGRDGHRFCSGWQLEPVAGSMDTARDNRRAWRTALAEDRQPDVPEPRARPVPTFEGGAIIFFVGHDKARDGYEIATLYPLPRDHGLSKYRTPSQ